MKTIAFVSSLILTLSIAQMSFSQTYFDVDNTGTSCDVEARALAWSFDNPGDCPANCNFELYSSGWVLCPGGSTTRIATSPTQGQWGAVEIRRFNSGGGSESTDGDCRGQSGTVSTGAACSGIEYVVWDNCNNATIK